MVLVLVVVVDSVCNRPAISDVNVSGRTRRGYMEPGLVGCGHLTLGL